MTDEGDLKSGAVTVSWMWTRELFQHVDGNYYSLYFPFMKGWGNDIIKF